MHPRSPQCQPCREAEAALPVVAEPSNLPATASESNSEEENIETVIATLLINASPKIQSLLRVALSVIEVQDFYGALPILVPNIVVHLDELSQAKDYASINALLATVNSLFMKFRYAFKTIDLLVDLKDCVDNFAKPLLGIFKRTASLIDQAMTYNEAAKVMANDVAQLMASEAANGPILKPCIDPILKLYIESQMLCCSIFYSLNFQEVPQFFKDHMCEWMVEFKKYLIHKYPTLEDYGDDVLDALRASVCENISLYVINEDELFQQDYLSGFVDDVVSLLVSYSSLGREQLTVAAIQFLITVSKSGHHILLSRCDILQQICQSIVIPNVMLQDEEEELFDRDPSEFIKRDMEGDDMNTRRGIACELLKGIAMLYKDIVREKVRNQIISCQDAFGIKRNWKYMDCAVRLVLSLATKNAGETSASTDLVDVQHFYVSYIHAVFQGWDVASFPMKKAGALKFLILFRNQILKQMVLYCLPGLSRLLASPDSVVHSYAAICIEKLLLVKDDEDRARYTSEDIRPVLPTMMKNLFWVLDYPDSAENQYVMKCIMRVVLVGDLDPDVASLCIDGLTYILHEACEIRKSPLFCQYLFESLSALIRRVCVLSQLKIRKLPKEIFSLVSLLEKKLYPCLQKILAEDIIEYFPYAFRLLEKLVDMNRVNVPALVSMLEAFLLKREEGSLSSVLEIYGKLVSSSDTEDQGFDVLNNVIEILGFEAISPYMRNVWAPLLKQLHNEQRTAKFAKNLIMFMSRFLVKDGSQNLVDSVNAVQPNAFQDVLEQCWIPGLKLITTTSPIELNLTCVASTRLICESPDTLDIMDIKLCGKMLNNVVTLLSRPEQQPEISDDASTSGFSPPKKKQKTEEEEEEKDPLKGIKDPREFLVVSLSNLLAAGQGSKYPQIIGELERDNQSALFQLFTLYKVSIQAIA